MSSQAKTLLRRTVIYGLIVALIIFYVVICNNGYGISCIYERLIHRPCLGCGATRAALSLLQFDVVSAIRFHPIYTLVLYPFIMLFLVQDYIICIINVIKKTKKLSLLTYLLYRV